MAPFEREKFMAIIAESCAVTASTIGLRTWSSAGTRYHNPFPENFAIAESVKRLRNASFRVMPEVVRHEVYRQGGVGPGNPGLMGPTGRFDLVAWSAVQQPIALVEYKWQFGSIRDDVRRLLVTTSKITTAESRPFVCLLAFESSREAVATTVESRRSRLAAHGARCTNHVVSRVVECDCYEAGRIRDRRLFFQASVMQVAPVA